MAPLHRFRISAASVHHRQSYPGHIDDPLLQLHQRQIRGQSVLVPDKPIVHPRWSYTQKLWMRVKRKAAYLPG